VAGTVTIQTKVDLGDLARIGRQRDTGVEVEQRARGNELRPLGRQRVGFLRRQALRAENHARGPRKARMSVPTGTS
jgi:hypothetical protein